MDVWKNNSLYAAMCALCVGFVRLRGFVRSRWFALFLALCALCALARVEAGRENPKHTHIKAFSSHTVLQCYANTVQ